MARSRIGVLWLIALLIPLASHAQDAERRRVARLEKTTLENVTAEDGFAYFSGHLPDSGNHPAMYAHIAGGRDAITVVGPGFMRDYPMKDWRKAVDAYRALLLANGYAVPAER